MYIKNMEQHASPWYSDSRFAPFWRQYNALMSAAHQDAICKAEHVANQARAALMSSLHNGPYHRKQQSLQPSHMLREKRFRKSQRRKKNKRRSRNHKLSNNPGNQSDTESLYSQMRQGMHIQDANDDMEVNEDFLLFLEQSKKHREEWKILKVKNDQEDTQTAATTTDKAAPHVESKEHPDVIRSREMQQLYGQASAKIQAMETALQLSFDRNATLHQPQYWPNIPITLMFS
ncbi:gem-associated protein 8-like isoform X2 [Portunus trituberculatus]|nr:gem-associated protein 8-like isoform X2 [Portunus trituberculatus]